MHAPVFCPGIFSGRNVSLWDFSPLQWYRTDIQSNKCIRGAFEAGATAGGQDGVSTASADAQSVLVGLCPTHTHILKFLLMFPRAGPPDTAPGRALSAVLDSPLTAVDTAPSHRLLSRRDAGSGDHRGLSLWHRVLRA